MSTLTDERAVELLEEMVRIKSLSTEETQLADYLVQRMTDLGFEAEVDAAGNSVGSIGRGPLTGVLLGHMDTVAGEVPVHIDDGKLYGRGTVDAKGPLATFVAASARLFQRRPDLPLRVIVVGAVEEEVTSSKGARYARDQYKPDFCINGEPSGWDGITLGYKGYLRANMTFRAPCSHTAHQAATIAERVCTTWENLHRWTTGFNQGRERAFDQLFTRLVHIETKSDGRYDSAQLKLNIRLPLDMSPEEAEAWLHEHLDADGELHVAGHMPAYAGPRTTALHRTLAGAIRKEGAKPRYLLKTGTADLNIIAPAWGCPALAYGPGDAALDHTPNEHIVLDEYLKGVRVLEETLERSVEAFAEELRRVGP